MSETARQPAERSVLKAAAALVAILCVLAPVALLVAIRDTADWAFVKRRWSRKLAMIAVGIEAWGLSPRERHITLDEER